VNVKLEWDNWWIPGLNMLHSFSRLSFYVTSFLLFS
jgi:hypothetical protein